MEEGAIGNKILGIEEKDVDQLNAMMKTSALAILKVRDRVQKSKAALDYLDQAIQRKAPSTFQFAPLSRELILMLEKNVDAIKTDIDATLAANQESDLLRDLSQHCQDAKKLLDNAEMSFMRTCGYPTIEAVRVGVYAWATLDPKAGLKDLLAAMFKDLKAAPSKIDEQEDKDLDQTATTNKQFACMIRQIQIRVEKSTVALDYLKQGIQGKAQSAQNQAQSTVANNTPKPLTQSTVPSKQMSPP